MKIRNLLTMFLIAATLVGCGTGANSSNDSSTGNSTSSLTNPVTENVVKIKKIDVNENQSQVQNIKARNIKKANDDSTEELNYTIITRPQSEVQFTITLDNPKAYGINALEISCDDENAEIMIEGEYKKISDYSIVLWSSENAYEKTYNIKTDSLDELTSFKVTDIRLEGETKFQSELTNSTDLGNNELQIYKMDTDAYELDVVSNTFEEIKFGIKVKEGVTNLSNFKVDGKEPDENGYWVMSESKEDCEISYDFELENGIKVSRSSQRWIGPMEIDDVSLDYDYWLRPKIVYNNDQPAFAPYSENISDWEYIQGPRPALTVDPFTNLLKLNIKLVNGDRVLIPDKVYYNKQELPFNGCYNIKNTVNPKYNDFFFYEYDLTGIEGVIDSGAHGSPYANYSYENGEWKYYSNFINYYNENQYDEEWLKENGTMYNYIAYDSLYDKYIEGTFYEYNPLGEIIFEICGEKYLFRYSYMYLDHEEYPIPMFDGLEKIQDSIMED